MRCTVLLLWLHASHRTYAHLPTSLVNDCIGILIPPITSIMNLSLSEGSFPSHCPWLALLKKPALNEDSMQLYRPVSKLNFLAEVLEKVVVNQLNSHKSSSNTSNQYQSAYRKFHSTETALLKTSTIFQHQWMLARSLH